MSTNREDYLLALKLQKDGKYKEALEIAYQITDLAFRAGILIDCGGNLGKIKPICEGISILEDILQSGHGRFSRASLLYNIGNGYSAVYDIRQRNRARTVAPNDDDLRLAKKIYREALAETKGVSSSFRSEILVNYGSCLSKLGRTVEAIQAYQSALDAEPQNGMAAGNLGIELDRFAYITGEYTHHYLLAAHELLQRACGSEMHLSYGDIESARAFHAWLDDLQKVIDAHKNGISPLKRTVLPKNKRCNRYIQFCLKHHLFLNAWVGDLTAMPATVDEIAFGPITMRLRKSHVVIEMLRLLNEIKEAYSTARYLFYLSQTPSTTIDDLSGMTFYFGTDELDDLHGLYIGLCKSAYMRSFDVLDKVARIANIYFGIGKRNDSFWNVFAEKQSRGELHELRYVARPAIVDTGNYGLYALSDLCIDYFESEHIDLKSIDARRNLMTHDFLAVTKAVVTTTQSQSSEVSLPELSRQTLAVLQLSKLAILYVVNSVHIAESQKGPPRKTQVVEYKHMPGQIAKALRKASVQS